MSYDAHGQMANWTAPSGTVGSAHYLYDAEGNRVLTNSANAGTTTDTISFDGYTETVLTGGTTTTTYYSANGSRVAVRIGGSTLDYLMSDDNDLVDLTFMARDKGFNGEIVQKAR